MVANLVDGLADLSIDGEKTVEATLGGGHHRVECETTNGSIRLTGRQ